ncbi:MAG: hypothetical protein PHQ43_08595 [Dehalococcoidales bacterium]|nr:hypothetical protein [Dehalococcoidales bacterium]
MAWANPRTWSVGEVVTAAIQNAHIRDLFRYLKGLDGVPTIESGLIIDNTDGDEYLKLPLLSTAEAASVLGAEGKLAFDEQTHAPKYHNGTAVKQVNLLSDCGIGSQAQGDILYFDGSTWARLGASTSGYVLKTQGAGANPIWDGGARGLAAAGNALLVSNDAASYNQETSYTLAKTIYLCDRGGTYRIKFDLQNVNGTGTTYGKIYRNGTPVGTERTKADNVFETFSEDISGWSAGDSVQLYCYGNPASGPRVDFRNLRVYASIREVSSST